MCRQINDLNHKVLDANLQIQNLQNTLDKRLNTSAEKDLMTLQTFSSNYSLSFPFSKDDDFKLFCGRIENEGDLKTDFVSILHYNCDNSFIYFINSILIFRSNLLNIALILMILLLPI